MKTLKNLITQIDKEELKTFYSSHSSKETCEWLGISDYHLANVLKYYEIEKHSKAENTRLTSLSRYGVSNPSMCKETVEKIASTKQERYGNANYNNASKIKETCIERYGTPSASGNALIRKRIKQTVQERYGVDNVFQDTDHLKQKCIEKYGSIENFYAQQQKAREESMIAKYGVANPSQIEGNRQKAVHSMRETCMERYGVEYPVLLQQVAFTSGNHSFTAPNNAFAEALDEAGVEYSREFPVSKFSYDFKVNDTLIEINPFCTHNSTWSPFGDDSVKSKTYHYDKNKLAVDNGFRCISVWDWDDVDKIITLLKPRDTLYARKCTVGLVDEDRANAFIESYHLQGAVKSDINIGLFYNGDLVSVMTFGKPRYNKKFEYELLRYCSSHKVVGGAEKLFKFFKENYNPKSIISYCDLSKFTGTTYDKLGFKLVSVSIGKHWYNPKTHKHITDNLLRQRGFDQLFNTNYGKGTSNEELMLEHGFVEIYDCGQATYTI